MQIFQGELTMSVAISSLDYINFLEKEGIVKRYMNIFNKISGYFYLLQFMATITISQII